jgi:hypothetical protein
LYRLRIRPVTAVPSDFTLDAKQLSLQKKNARVKLPIQTKFALDMAKMAPLFAMTIQRLTRQPKKTRLASITSPLLEYG